MEREDVSPAIDSRAKSSGDERRSTGPAAGGSAQRAEAKRLQEQEAKGDQSLSLSSPPKKSSFASAVLSCPDAAFLLLEEAAFEGSRREIREALAGAAPSAPRVFSGSAGSLFEAKGKGAESIE